MHILGISLGSSNGNSEILLKAALNSATAANPSITTTLISLYNLALPVTPLPKPGSPPPPADSPPDDRPALLSEILAADALILSSPIYSRQPAGLFKLFCDTAMGPFVDAVFVANAIEIQKKGGVFIPGWIPDERVLKPRVVGLIAQGGATSSEWGTLALPGMQQGVFSLHAKVVDQVLIRGQGFPGSVLIEGSDALPLAERVGRSVASQIGKKFDEAEYLGEKGACPYCNLSLVELVGTSGVECGVCGAKGKLEADGHGTIKPVFEKDSKSSVITWKGKEVHMVEIQDVAKGLGPSVEGVQQRKAEFGRMEFGKVDFPSKRTTEGAKL